LDDVENMNATDLAALLALSRRGGSMLVSYIPDRTGTDELGEIDPGIAVYRRLEAQGLLVLTEEEPLDDGFLFTPTAELTEAGWLALLAQGYSRSRH